MKKRRSAFILFSMIIVLLSSCNIPKATSVPPVIEEDPVKTAAALTVAALTTQLAATSEGNVAPTPTPQPSETSQPSNTPLPTNTPMPTATNTPQGVCDQAGFVTETVADDTDFAPNSTFTKTWTLKNTGTCTWNSSYALVFTNGNAMGAPAAKQITTGTVAPGQSVTISVDMTAPSSVGRYKGEYKLRNSNGVIFGLGADNKSFWVQIDVVVINTTNFFVNNLCAATWTSSAGNLTCPGEWGNHNGFFFVDHTPLLENGYQDDEPGIWMAPQYVNDGWIKAVFPAISITSGKYFETILGCNQSYDDCNARIRLNYKADGGPEQNLALWTEINDGLFNRIKLDLSSLAGKSVQFIFIVEANGSPSDDLILWFMPVITP